MRYDDYMDAHGADHCAEPLDDEQDDEDSIDINWFWWI